MSYVDMVKRSGALQSAFTAVARIPKPVVAAITGYALGGGCELALCADVRFAAEDAALGQPEILLGIIPGAGGTQRLTRLVGPSRAKDLIFTGRFVKADEALAIGLVDRVVPADQVYDEARGLGAAVRRRRDVRPARGQGGDRPGPRGRPRHRPGDRAPAVRGAVRHRGPPDRDDVVRRERSRQGAVRGPLSELRDTFACERLRAAVGCAILPARPTGADRRVLTGVARRWHARPTRPETRSVEPRPRSTGRRRRRPRPTWCAPALAQVIWIVCVVAALILAGGRAVHRAQGEPRQRPGEVLHRHRRQARLRCLLPHRRRRALDGPLPRGADQERPA